MVVEELMTANPVSADSAENLKHVWNLLYQIDVRHLPITEEGQLVGIVSDRDLREIATSLSVSSHSSDLWQEPISKFMSTDVVSVGPEDDISDVIDLIVEQKIGAVPVVLPGTQELVGIVSYVDVIQAARSSL